jgi:hypothetical protein
MAYVEKEAKALDMEAKVMANVDGWQVGASVYNTKLYAPPMCNDIQM